MSAVQVPAATLAAGDFFRNYGPGFMGRFVDDVASCRDGRILFVSHRCADVAAVHGLEIWTYGPDTPVWIDEPSQWDRRCPCGWTALVPVMEIERHGGRA